MTQTMLIGLIGFPSSFAAMKWLDANAVGPTEWRLNGHPGSYTYIPRRRR